MPTTTKKATRKPAAKKAAPAKPEAAPAPSTRKDLLARMNELGYAGPASYTATVLRDVVLPWLEAGSPEGDESIPTGVRFAVHPHLRPAPKAGNGEARAVVRELRMAASAALTSTGDDLAERLNEVDGLAARLREVLAS